MCIRVWLTLIIAILYTPLPACGGIAEDMARFWDSVGGTANITGPTAFDGQSAGYYSMGSVVARTPVRNTQLASIRFPHYRAGCGGIDLYSGAFSFINSDQLVATMKAIGNNAAAFAFNLALETISPAINETIQEIESKMRWMNSMNINSCETAAALVGGVWPQQDRASELICATAGNWQGTYADYFSAKHQCGSGGGRHQVNKNLPAELKQLHQEDKNIAWQALKTSGLVGVGSEFDTELAELFMTLSGTIIIKSATSEHEGTQMMFIQAAADQNNILRALLDGGNIKSHQCAPTDQEECVEVIPLSRTHQVAQNQGFKIRVESLLLSIADKILSDTPLTHEEKSFLNATPLPVYKLLNVHTANGQVSSLFEISTYAEIIAVDIVHDYLNKILKEVSLASSALLLNDSELLKDFRQSIIQVRRTLLQRQQRKEQTVNTILALIDRTNLIENQLIRGLGAKLSHITSGR